MQFAPPITPVCAHRATRFSNPLAHSQKKAQTTLQTDTETNTYAGISDYYDMLMLGGYYNYNDIAEALHKVLSPRKKILELGVGTGLLAEQLLKNNTYAFTGIDNTNEMLEQAKERLGEGVHLQMQDIVELNLGETFEASFSVGGCWYFIDYGDRLEFCSHIPELKSSLKGLQKVVDHLEPGGLIAFSLQGPHTDYAEELKEGVTYSQTIEKAESGFIKEYVFKKGNEVLASQTYHYLTLSSMKIDEVFVNMGCKPLGLDAERRFFTYQKNTK